METLLIEEGNNVVKIREALTNVKRLQNSLGKPILVIVNTTKGIGLPCAQTHFSGYHTISVCPKEAVQKGIDLLRTKIGDQVEVARAVIPRTKITDTRSKETESAFTPAVLDLRPDASTPNHPDWCQLDYFKGLKRVAEDGTFNHHPLYFLTADVTTQQQVQLLKLCEFCRYYNVGIREQHMIAFAHGLSVTDSRARIIINSFDAFLYRCLDQINAAVQGGSSMVIIADLAGLTNSRNGRTHQTTGQPGAALMLPGLTFLEPWDAQDTFNCLNWAIGQSRGVVYLRIHSSSIPEIGNKSFAQRNLQYYVVRDGEEVPKIVVIASGIMVTSALIAAKTLADKGIPIRVINVINPKSLDQGFTDLIPSGASVLTLYNGVPPRGIEPRLSGLSRTKISP